MICVWAMAILFDISILKQGMGIWNITNLTNYLHTRHNTLSKLTSERKFTMHHVCKTGTTNAWVKINLLSKL